MGTGDGNIRSCAAAQEAVLLVNIVNHSGLLSALREGRRCWHIDQWIHLFPKLLLCNLSYCGGLDLLPCCRLTPLGNTRPPWKFREMSKKCGTQITLQGHKRNSPAKEQHKHCFHTFQRLVDLLPVIWFCYFKSLSKSFLFMALKN